MGFKEQADLLPALLAGKQGNSPSLIWWFSWEGSTPFHINCSQAVAAAQELPQPQAHLEIRTAGGVLAPMQHIPHPVQILLGIAHGLPAIPAEQLFQGRGIFPQGNEGLFQGIRLSGGRRPEGKPFVQPQQVLPAALGGRIGRPVPGWIPGRSGGRAARAGPPAVPGLF